MNKAKCIPKSKEKKQIAHCTVYGITVALNKMK